MFDFGTTFDSNIAALLAEYPDADVSKSLFRAVINGGESSSLKLNMDSSVSGDDAQATILANMEIDGTTITTDAAASGETASALVKVSAEEGSGVEVITDAKATGDLGDVVTAETNISPESGIVEQEKVETPDDGSLTVESSTHAYYTDLDPHLFDATLIEPFALEPSLTW